MLAFSGCSAMLVGGGAESEQKSECTESEKEAKKSGC